MPAAPRRLTRRWINLVLAGIMVSLSGVIQLLAAQEPPKLTVAAAVQFIRQSGNKLVTIMNGPGDWAFKRQQLQALVNAAIDINGVGRFALGRFWKLASEPQKAEFERLLPSVLIGSVGRAVGAFQGMSFTIERGAQINDDVAVSTTVLRPGDPPRQVTWMISTIDGAPKIVDVIAEGASMRITERDDCLSYLTQGNHSIQSLIDMLRQREAAAT